MSELEKLSKSKRDNTRTFREICYVDNVEVPMWAVDDVYGLVKLIGHAKYLNREYGTVVLRGQTKEHHSMKPAAYRKNLSTVQNAMEAMFDIIKNDEHNPNLSSYLHCIPKYEDEMCEAILQHYCYDTRLLDVVDNIWVALWFASHIRDNNGYNDCLESSRYKESSEECSYVYLFGIPQSSNNIGGVEKDDTHCLVDIRRACPSTILRPHMQHGMVVGFYDQEGKFKESYAEQLIAIVRIETRKCLEWIKNDHTLTAEMLFPCPEYDDMYRMILERRKDLFDQLDNILKGGNTNVPPNP